MVDHHFCLKILKMSIEYIRYNISEAKQEDFITAYSMASEQLDNSEHCLAYELAQCEEEHKSFILRIEWTSMENHLNGFRKSKDFMIFLNPLDLFSRISLKGTIMH